jgi:hypothetical protein
MTLEVYTLCTLKCHKDDFMNETTEKSAALVIHSPVDRIPINGHQHAPKLITKQYHNSLVQEYH